MYCLCLHMHDSCHWSNGAYTLCCVKQKLYAHVERDQTLISCYCSWHATCSQALSKLWSLNQSLLRKMINPQLDCCKPSSKWQKARWGLWNEASTDYPSQWIPTCWAFHLQRFQGYCTQNHGKMRLQSSSISKLYNLYWLYIWITSQAINLSVLYPNMLWMVHSSLLLYG